jgi:hypothetical protein
VKRFIISAVVAAMLFGCSSARWNVQYEFKDKFADQLDEGSELIGAGYHYTYEKLSDSLYVYKQYYPRKKQVILRSEKRDKAGRIAHGKYEIRGDEGQMLIDGHFENGEPSGVWKYYHVAHGGLHKSGEIQDGKMEGLWQQRDTSGAVVQEINFRGGKIHGDVRHYDNKGELRKIEVYKNDSLIEEEVFIEYDESDDRIPYLKICEGQPDPRECTHEEIGSKIMSRMEYPPLAGRYGISGRAYVVFEVDTLGEVTNTRVIRGLCDEIKSECEKAIGRLPSWEPAVQKGEKVPITFTQVLTFSMR